MMRLDFTDPMFEQLKQVAEGHNETHSSDLLGKEVTLSRWISLARSR